MSGFHSPMCYDSSHIPSFIDKMKDVDQSCALATDLRKGSWIDVSFFVNLSADQALEVADFSLWYVLPNVLDMIVRYTYEFQGDVSFGSWYYLMSRKYYYDPNEGVTFSDGYQPYGDYSLGKPCGVSWIDYPRLHNIDPYDLVRFVKIVKYALEEKTIQVFDRPYELCMEMVRSEIKRSKTNEIQIRRFPSLFPLRRQRFHDIYCRKMMEIINEKPGFKPVVFVTEECPICYETTCPISGDFVKTKCNHIFHGTCLKKWIENQQTNEQKTCPYCRSKL